jgi:hypothetical protein
MALFGRCRLGKELPHLGPNPAQGGRGRRRQSLPSRFWPARGGHDPGAWLVGRGAPEGAAAALGDGEEVVLAPPEEDPLEPPERRNLQLRVAAGRSRMVVVGGEGWQGCEFLLAEARAHISSSYQHSRRCQISRGNACWRKRKHVKEISHGFFRK